MSRSIPPILVMGVQGSGKSTIGMMLAEKLGITFLDGDSLHSPENIAKMAAGVPLDDADRMPWLAQIGNILATERHSGIIVACSALKRRYRDLIRDSAPDLFIVHPEGPIELVAARISTRQHEYMPATLLSSQYTILEPRSLDERGVTVDISCEPSAVIDAVAIALAVGSSTRTR